MPGILIDSNVLLDVCTEGAEWFDWSSAQLNTLAIQHRLCINPVIYGEISYGYDYIEDLESAIEPLNLHRLHLPWEASFLAAKCHYAYRQRGGLRTATLPDFFIGAHASLAGLTLLTRDKARYRTYFPKLQMIHP